MGTLTNVERARRKVLLEQGLKKCCRCKVVKSVDEFCTCNRMSDGLYSCCKECKRIDPKNRESRRRYGERNHQKFKEYKKTLECKLCGYDKDSAKLHFHHRDSATKLYDIGNRTSSFGSEKFLKELAKCDVLCKPCHIEYHGTQ